MMRWKVVRTTEIEKRRLKTVLRYKTRAKLTALETRQRPVAVGHAEQSLPSTTLYSLLYCAATGT